MIRRLTQRYLNNYNYSIKGNFSRMSTTSKTRFQIASDIHLEKYPKNKLPKLKPAAENIILSGDIGDPFCESYSQWLGELSKERDNIYLGDGNHEYYQNKKTMDQVKDQINKVVTQFPNVHYLNNSTAVNKDIVILGTTLWTDVPQSEYDLISRGMTDYYTIYKQVGDEIDTITVNDTNAMYRKNVAWLESEIEKHKDKKIIVMTHHVPSMSLLNPKYGVGGINHGFASNLDRLIKPPVVLWTCGHTHSHKVTNINGVTCVVNPKGYPREQGFTGFKDDLVVEV